ncbi:MAG: PAS domain S-box protein [Phenylobacterium zucineum]|nr:MAG: PAS domain S-box protein [Phenylobacterium zucineum]
MRELSSLAAAQTALDDIDLLAPLALERSPTPVVVTDPRRTDNPIVLANQAFLDLCGYPADEVIGRNCRFLQGPETDPGSIARLRQAVATATPATVELLNYRADGAAYWNRIHLSPVHDASGSLAYFFAAQTDLTTQREAEALRAAEHRLLLEVDHRAMNALALVQGIVRLTRAGDVRSYAEAIQARVGALARAHKLLSERNWSAARLDDLIRCEVTPANDPRVSLSGPDLLVGPHQVQPLILALHEMVANARRHGALGRPDGRVSVTWAREGETIGIRWVEHGCPGAAPGAPGFGTQMIDAIFRRQLGGGVTRDWRSDGLTLALSFGRANDNQD